MKIVRSILAVVLGGIVNFAAITSVHVISGKFYPLPNELKAVNPTKMSAAETEMFIAFIKTMPTEAHLLVFLAWVSGAFLGGAVAALVAGWGRLGFAGVIGAFVLLGTIMNFQMLPDAHPTWMVIAGYVQPIPVSLLAGWLVGMMLPAKKVELS